jgi:hypothetical protein
VTKRARTCRRGFCDATRLPHVPSSCSVHQHEETCAATSCHVEKMVWTIRTWEEKLTTIICDGRTCDHRLGSTDSVMQRQRSISGGMQSIREGRRACVRWSMLIGENRSDWRFGTIAIKATYMKKKGYIHDEVFLPRAYASDFWNGLQT